MDLFAFPVEIRLKIYSELLVHPGTIDFEPLDLYTSPQLLLCRNIDLCPALLRTSRQIYDEAISLLYSDNRFRVPEEIHDDDPGPDTPIAVFLRLIGTRADLLRHICIAFPRVSSYWANAERQDGHVSDLDLVRYACPGVTSLELPLRFHSDVPISTPALDLTDMRLKAFPFLRHVTVQLKVCLRDTKAPSDDDPEDIDLDEDRRDPVGCLTTNLCDRGWTVKITYTDDKLESGEDFEDFDGPFGDWEDENDEDEQRRRWEWHVRMGYADDGGPA